MIESRIKWNKNQLHWITIKKVVHQTSNKGQCCQQPNYSDLAQHNWWHLSCWEGVKGQVWIPTDNNLPCEVGGHLGRGVGVYWAADLTCSQLEGCYKCSHYRALLQDRPVQSQKLCVKDQLLTYQLDPTVNEVVTFILQKVCSVVNNQTTVTLR